MKVINITPLVLLFTNLCVCLINAGKAILASFGVGLLTYGTIYTPTTGLFSMIFFIVLQMNRALRIYLSE